MQKLKHYALSDDDINQLAPGVNIITYPELEGRALDSVFDAQGRAIVLFLTEDKNSGHWLTLLRKPDHIEVFDSFGTEIDGWRKWISKAKRIQFHEVAPLLHELLDAYEKDGGKVIHNTTKLQDESVDTCGRYAGLRARNHQTSLRNFVGQLISKGHPDDTVVRETYALIGK